MVVAVTVEELSVPAVGGEERKRSMREERIEVEEGRETRFPAQTSSLHLCISTISTTISIKWNNCNSFSFIYHHIQRERVGYRQRVASNLVKASWLCHHPSISIHIRLRCAICQLSPRPSIYCVLIMETHPGPPIINLPPNPEPINVEGCSS